MINWSDQDFPAAASPKSAKSESSLLQTDKSPSAKDQVIQHLNVQQMTTLNDFACHDHVFRRG